MAQRRRECSLLINSLRGLGAPPLNGGAAMNADQLEDLCKNCLSVALSERELQTLMRLLQGDSEKEAAQCLGVSRHTVHVYVKSLHRRFDVHSRGELLAEVLHRLVQAALGLSERAAPICRARQTIPRATLVLRARRPSVVV